MVFDYFEVKRLHIKSTMGKPFTIYGWVLNSPLFDSQEPTALPVSQKKGALSVESGMSGIEAVHQWLSAAVLKQGNLYVSVAAMAHSWRDFVEFGTSQPVFLNSKDIGWHRFFFTIKAWTGSGVRLCSTLTPCHVLSIPSLCSMKNMTAS